MPKLLSLQPEHRGEIVLVADGADDARSVGGALRAEFGDDRVRATDDPREAAAWLKAARPAALVTALPDGSELVAQLAEAWGPTPTVVLSDAPNDDAAGGRRGALAYLPRPFTPEALIAAVRGLLASAQETFHGPVVVSTLSDILQLYAISGATGMLAVSSGARRGEIWFERGQVTHATNDGVEGFESFCDQISWTRGSFAWHPRRADRQTIRMSVSALMMEAHRLQEEASSDATRRTKAPPPLDPADAVVGHPTLYGLTSNEVAAALKSAVAPAPTPSLRLVPAPAPTRPPPEAVVDEALGEAAGPLLDDLRGLDGFLGAAVVDGEGDAPARVWSVGDDPRATPADNAHLLDLLRATVAHLDLADEIEDVVVTMGSHHHLIRPLRGRPRVFLHLALDREHSNLALARLRLAVGANDLTV